MTDCSQYYNVDSCTNNGCFWVKNATCVDKETVDQWFTLWWVWFLVFLAILILVVIGVFLIPMFFFNDKKKKKKGTVSLSTTEAQPATVFQVGVTPVEKETTSSTINIHQDPQMSQSLELEKSVHFTETDKTSTGVSADVFGP